MRCTNNPFPYLPGGCVTSLWGARAVGPSYLTAASRTRMGFVLPVLAGVGFGRILIDVIVAIVDRTEPRQSPQRAVASSTAKTVASSTEKNVSPQGLADDAVVVDVLPYALDLEKYVSAVEHPGAGGITTFSGVTRDNFQGKKVFHLEYEAYEPMARKIMKEICHEAGKKWAVKRIALAHKVGSCGVGQTSVIVAVSSAHREASLKACHWVIDELKKRVPIWKKEIYEGGEVWKENVESKDISGAYVMA